MKKIYIIEIEHVSYYRDETVTWYSVLPTFFLTREDAVQAKKDEMEAKKRTSCESEIIGSRVYMYRKNVLIDTYAYGVTELNAAE